MGYFNNFPTFYYDIKSQRKFELVVDILRRVRINTAAQESLSNYGEYIIKDHDRPDTIAHKLYGDSELHWVILLFNEIHNPYYEWPMNRQSFENYCAEKYPGRAYLIELDQPIKNSAFSDVRLRKDHKIEAGHHGYAVSISGSEYSPIFDTDSSFYKRVKVLAWDRTLQKAVVQEEDGSFADNERIVFALTGGETLTASGIVRRNQLNMESVRYFLDNLGIELCPFGTYSGEIQSGTASQKTYTLDEYGRFAPLPYNQTVLGSYTLEDDNYTLLRAVTNLEYEELNNEERRKIKLPLPDSVREIAAQFDQLINEEI
jgi:hypothetical protein